MGVDVKIAGTNYTGVPYITLPLTAGGSVKFCEVSDTTATASDVASGKTFYTADGELETGTASIGVDTRKSFTVVQKPNQTLSVAPLVAVAELFSTSTDSSGNMVYKTEYPSEVYITLTPDSGYNAGKITINGTEKDSTTVDHITFSSDIVDGMVISATDATIIPVSSKTFTDVTLSLSGEYDESVSLLTLSVNTQTPESPKIYEVAAGNGDIIAPGLGIKYTIAFILDGKYFDCTIKLDTNTGYSENTNISYSSNDDFEMMLGEISEQMFAHLKETIKDNGRVILTITVVS